jgi:cytochrome c551/c552
MSKLTFGTLVIALCASGAAFADANLDLAAEKKCMNCHTLNAGSEHAPSFKAIARKYRSHDNADTFLVKTVMQGNPVSGGYHWGLMPEPGPGVRSQVSEPEARQLVQWILRMR